MDASATLNVIFHALAHQAGVKDQIEWLKRENRKLGQEQAAGMRCILDETGI